MQISNLEHFFKNKSVALVGNAQSQDKKKQGKSIESHDMVCRINRGPLKTPSKTHGNRTDILFYGDPGQILETVVDKVNPHTPCIVLYNKFADRKHPLQNIILIDKPTERWIIKSCGYSKPTMWPSNGLSAFFIITKCVPKSLSLFGFDWKETPTFYRDDTRGDERHDYNLEKGFIQGVVATHENINIY